MSYSHSLVLNYLTYRETYGLDNMAMCAGSVWFMGLIHSQTQHVLADPVHGSRHSVWGWFVAPSLMYSAGPWLDPAGGLGPGMQGWTTH